MSGQTTKPFPIYETLTSSNYPLDPLDISNRISELNDEQQEIIAALIYHHTLLEKAVTQVITKSKKISIPYSGKSTTDTKTGLIFAMNLLPETLQKILTGYIVTY